MNRGRRRAAPRDARRARAADGDALWYKDAIIYEVRVRSFYDSDGDGIGDFRGLTEKLDYLQDLGVTALWLLPFYPSPLRDDGYDIADYTDVHPDCGTLDDFKALPARGAPARHPRRHRAGHQPHLGPAPVVPARPPRAARQPRARLLRLERHARSATPARGSSSRTSSARTGPGTRVAKAYYWHRFYSHQPDLNFDNPDVPRGDLPGRSTSGSTSASTACASTPSPTCTSARGRTARTCPRRTRSCSELRAHVDAQLRRTACSSPRPTSGPRTPSPTSASGDECHMAFHFPIMPRLFMALHMEDRFPIIDILAADARRSPTTASGRCSCATTTS